MPRKKILIIANHRKNRSPGQRFRFEQYLDFLQENGFDYDFSYLISQKDDQYFYKKGYYGRKLWVLLKSYWIRYSNLRRIKSYDLIFIYREALMTGSVFFEKQFKKKQAKMILDFDDSIWLMDVSRANAQLKFLKNPEKTKTLLKLVDMAFVGNRYLADYAEQYCSNVKIIPTTLNTGLYSGKIQKTDSKICIGWIGSTTTIAHLEWALPMLRKLEQIYGDKIYIKVIADVSLISDLKSVKNTKWSSERETEEISEIDIGIMPLPDTPWTRGKCGFKGLQYMSFGIPAVLSPVGVNNEIIQDGVNGFLADSEEEWIEKTGRLIADADLRKRLGEAGRKTVEERYSFNAQKYNYLKFFKELCGI